jgi:hypothetical protein
MRSSSNDVRQDAACGYTHDSRSKATKDTHESIKTVSFVALRHELQRQQFFEIGRAVP